MNPIELFHADGKPTGIFYCEKCRNVGRTKEDATGCCVPHICVCGAECKPYYTKCEKCCDAERKAKEAATLAKAEKLDSWDGPVMCEEVGYNDGYFRSVDDLMDHLAELAGEHGAGEYESPEFAYVCESIPFTANLEDLTHQASDQMYEGFDFDDLDGLDELKAAIEKFNTANTKHVRWEPDYKRAVRLPPLEVEHE